MIGLIVLFFIGLIFGPPLVLAVIGLRKRKIGKPESAKIFYILAVVYLVVAGGTCLTILGGV